MNIFVDTGAFFALYDLSDSHHRDASDFAIAMEGQNRFVTSSLVVSETWQLIRNKLGYSVTMDFLERVRGGAGQI